jgi:Domain of unknown function (DUF4124)
MKRAAPAIALLVLATAANAQNRCVAPSGRITYSDAPCATVGARLERQVREGISVSPALPRAAPAAVPPSIVGTPDTPPKRPFRKSPASPVLTVCYDPQDARADVSRENVEAAIVNALSLWNAGCNITYQYAGICAPNDGTWRRERPDYKVWWDSWDDSLTITDDPRSTAREHAIAAASPTIGVVLNRDIPVFAQRYRRSIVHEFGHVVGIGHSRDPNDVMFSGGRNAIPTAWDLEACNKTIEVRYGVKPLPD